jgi:hypothetical protein
MYVWKPSQAQAVTTLKAPAGDCWESAVPLIWWHFLSATADPMALGMPSDNEVGFAGVMYPVGYQVISDNLEYEDETS